MYKKTNWIKRGALAAVTAGLMFGALPGMAVAADVHDSSNPTITKTWDYTNSILNGNQSFEFLLEYDENTAPEPIGSNPVATPELKDNQFGKVTVNVKDDGKDSDKTANDKVSTGQTTLNQLVNQFNFTKPGSYYFTLTEVDGGNGNIDYDTETSYKVRVDVVWNTADSTYNTTKIDGCYILTKDANNEVVKSNATFANKSTASASPLTISKEVAGTAANTEDYFYYTLEISSDVVSQGLVGNSEYPVYKDGHKIATLSAKNAVNFFLKDGESVTVPGLPGMGSKGSPEKQGVYVKVTESDRVVSLDENGNPVVPDENAVDNGYHELYWLNESVKYGSADKDVEVGRIANFTIGKDAKNTVAYTNNKGFAPQTGITMNTLPFVGVAAVAAAGVVTLVISRKRRAGEEF